MIYGSLDRLYVFDERYTWEDGTVTRILAFDWDAETGGIDFVATGQIAGRMLNQFSADEHAGFLRVAATISNHYSGNWSGRSENVLFVLRDDGGVLEFAGSLRNLALDESIYSVRFLGQRAFITTFRDIDPLFAVDLSEPSNPRAVGPRINLGVCLFHTGRLDQAAEAFQEALKLDSGRAEAWVNLAEVWRRQGRRKAALEAYDRALTLMPGDANLRRRVAGFRRGEL